jgi:hypothetical protein
VVFIGQVRRSVHLRAKILDFYPAMIFITAAQNDFKWIDNCKVIVSGSIGA